MTCPPLWAATVAYTWAPTSWASTSAPAFTRASAACCSIAGSYHVLTYTTCTWASGLTSRAPIVNALTARLTSL